MARKRAAFDGAPALFSAWLFRLWPAFSRIKESLKSMDCFYGSAYTLESLRVQGLAGLTEGGCLAEEKARRLQAVCKSSSCRHHVVRMSSFFAAFFVSTH
jgi:hypothetical protein